jgi:2-methylcitrate dehydratase PrpD
VAVGGADHEAAPVAVDLVRSLGGSPQATVLVHGVRTSVANAAFANGVSSHVLDFDDTHIPTILHPTGPIASAALAIAEWRGLSGAELVRAHVVALEAAARVSIALYPEHYDAGWHMSGTTGTVGAGIAAAVLCGASGSQLVHAFGIAATQAAGHREQFGSMSKSLHVGKAASNGVFAGMLAKRGFTSAPDSLQGRRGMLRVMSGSGDGTALSAGLGSDWEIDRVGIKPYACGVVAHPPIDAARRLRSEHGVAGDEVEAIELRVNPLVVELTGNPRPRTGLEGKFSVAFCAAVALLEGAAGPRQFTDETVRRADVVALRDRITPRADASLNHSQAEAVARLFDGREVRVRIEAASGTPESPLTDDELRAKFRDLTEPVLGPAQARILLDYADGIEGLESLEPLVTSAVRPA